MFEILKGTKGICKLCRGKAAKEKEVFVVKGAVSGNLCPDHLYALSEEKKEPETPPALFDKAS